MKIFIVEDDFRIADMYKEYLLDSTNVTEVSTANNAEHCLKLLEIEEKPDLILIDIYLPDMLGSDLMERIIKKHPYIDFIVITASQEGTVFKKMLRLGAKQYLIKPVKLERLATIVNDYIYTNHSIDHTQDVNQKNIDRYFSDSKNHIEYDSLPKGIDSVTLQSIEKAFETENQWTSLQLGNHLGTSRTTVRRYLEYLRQSGKLDITHEYGDKGRPEKKYTLK